MTPIPKKMEPPTNWLKTIENIRRTRKQYPAPVDSMGCDQAHDKSDMSLNQRFQVLVSLMLSSQTKDPITWAAVQKLREAGLANVQGIMGAKEKDIEDLIYPVGFYRRKAVYLKKVAEILYKDYQGDIPKSVEDLCKLPGVGPKMAHLCMLEAWDTLTGIGVDTHVHRIAARLNWVPKIGIKDPEDTRKALQSWMPQEYWREINRLLVGFGQTICTPLHPKCKECNNSDICPSANLSSPKKTKVKRATVKIEPANNIRKRIKKETSPQCEEYANSDTSPSKTSKYFKRNIDDPTKKTTNHLPIVSNIKLELNEDFCT